MEQELKSYYRYWGKAERDGESYHLLPYHSLDVAAVGHVLLKRDLLLRKRLTSLTGLDEINLNYWMHMFLAVHDIGKFSISFQGLRQDVLLRLQTIETTKRYSVRHDSLGYLLWRDSAWPTSLPGGLTNDVEYWEGILEDFSKSFAGHHGVPPRMIGPNTTRLRVSDYFEQGDIDAAKSFISDVQALINRDFPPKSSKLSPIDLYERSKPASWLLAGFVVLCDWIGSNILWFRFCDEPMLLDQYWEKKAIPEAETALEKAGIAADRKASRNVLFGDLFPSFNSLTPLQRFVAECAISGTPQLFILEDITGSGKTEAALFLARRMMTEGAGKGLFVALPTMATSNAMFDRLAERPSPTEFPAYRRLFEQSAEPSIVLAHSARHLSDTFMKSIVNSEQGESKYEESEETAAAQCASWLADNRKKALLADVGVGTLDQALLAILPSRFQSLRLFGLAGNILIVDEAHAYDPYMNMLLQNLLTFHAAMGGSAILLSATLPQHMRQAMLNSFAKGIGIEAQAIECNDYPLATSISQENGVGETSIEAMPQRKTSVAVGIEPDQNQIVRLIVEASMQGKCVCWMRNTVHDALHGHEALRDAITTDRLMLFHSQFVMGDRLDIEKRVSDTFGKKSGEVARSGRVLVATQVVEQSLDLDFDLLISDLAPMDLLIQRAGRLHRHLRDERGNPLADGKGPNRRESARFIVHSPEPSELAGADWFKKAFPKGAYVYPSHGCLWLTAHLLADKKTLRMPEDARELVEAAFSEKADELIPASLRKRDEIAEAKWQADKSLAHINMLKLEEGYAATTNQWLEDMRTPTRLGEMETTVHLARWDGAKLTPLYEHGKFPWDMSQVSIRSVKVLSEAEVRDPCLKEAVDKLKATLPDKGKWSLLIPMVDKGDRTWQGEAINKKGRPVIVIYTRTQGVQVIDKEAQDDAIQSD